MKKINYNLLSFELIRYLLIIIFLYTTYHKLIDLKTFEESLLRSKLLSDFSVFLKYLIPILEIIIIIFLFIDKYIMLGLYSSLLLLSTFTIYLISLNNFSIFYGCSCGGVFNQMSFFEHIIANAFLILLNVLGIFMYNKKYYN